LGWNCLRLSMPPIEIDGSKLWPKATAWAKLRSSMFRLHLSY
jgi:hypothetical protein